MPSIPVTPTAADAARNCRRLKRIVETLPWARMIASVTHRSAQGQAREGSAAHQRPVRGVVAPGVLRAPGELRTPGEPEPGRLVPGDALGGGAVVGKPVVGLTPPLVGCPVRGSIAGVPARGTVVPVAGTSVRGSIGEPGRGVVVCASAEAATIPSMPIASAVQAHAFMTYLQSAGRWSKPGAAD